MALRRYENRPDLRDVIDLEDIFSDDDDFSDLIEDHGFSMCGARRLAKQVKSYREVVVSIENEFAPSFDVDELMTDYISGLSYDVGRELDDDISQNEVDEMAEDLYDRLRIIEKAGNYSPIEGTWIDLNPPIYGLHKEEFKDVFSYSVNLALEEMGEDGYVFQE